MRVEHALAVGYVVIFFFGVFFFSLLFLHVWPSGALHKCITRAPNKEGNGCSASCAGSSRYARL